MAFEPPFRCLFEGYFPTIPPSIVTQPLSQSVGEGSPVIFTIVAAGAGFDAFTYQWFKNGVAIGGATANQYTIGVANAGDIGTYTCAVTNPLGDTTISDGASLSVIIAPTIITQPTPTVAIEEGDELFLSVAATGTTPFTYQWLKNGDAIPGATSSALVVNAALGDAGTYRVVVSNAAGSVTSNAAVVTVVTAPVITVQPAGGTVNSGGAISLSVTASSSVSLTYQWRKGGVNIPGATASTYVINPCSKTDAGSYDCVVTTSAIPLSVTSAAAVMVVQYAPTITSQPSSDAVIAGANATFTVVADGLPAPTYQWRKNGSNIPGATAATYTITGVGSGDEASYDCVVTNSRGSVTSEAAALTVALPPVILVQPVGQVLAVGESFTLTVVANDPPTPTYQWKKNGVNIPGATSASYVVPSGVSGDTGTYTVVVTNIAGSTTSDAVSVSVVPPTLYHILITGQSNAIGGGSAVGTGPATHGYMFNGGIIPGGSAPSLSSLVPLQESKTTADGQTPATTMVNWLDSRMASLGARFLVSNVGIGGAAYSTMKKGTTPYNDSLAQITAGKARATALGMSYKVLAIVNVHGEQDDATPVAAAAYKDNLIQWQADYQTDISAITGDPSTIPMFISQQIAYPAEYRYYDNADSGTAIQAWKANLAQPDKVVLVCPENFMKLVNNPHFETFSYMWLGEYFAKAIYQHCVLGTRFVPLYPTSAVLSGNTVVITFNREIQAKFDWVAFRDDWAFRYYDSTGSASVTSVAITAPTQITLTLSAVPTGANKAARYLTRFDVSSNPGSGPVCDFDATTGLLGMPLNNYCVNFNVPIT